jgi:hypothetical protein
MAEKMTEDGLMTTLPVGDVALVESMSAGDRCALYIMLCLEDAVERLWYWLRSECNHRSRAIAEPVLLLCALRLRATKCHYWQTVEQFTTTLDTPLQRLTVARVDSDKMDDILERRIRRFVEIYVVASVCGRTVGSLTKPADYPVLDFERYSSLFDVGETFGKALQTITSLANAGPAKPSTDNAKECSFLFTMFEPDKQ